MQGRELLKPSPGEQRGAPCGIQMSLGHDKPVQHLPPRSARCLSGSPDTNPLQISCWPFMTFRVVSIQCFQPLNLLSLALPDFWGKNRAP